MDANLSLVLFTCLAQAAVGMVFLLLFVPHRVGTFVAPGNIIMERLNWPGGYALALALVLFGLGVIFSLLHLSDPLISFYSITNLATSWLSREILFVGLFGITTLVLFFVRNLLLNILAAVFGIGLIYVMSQVYMTPPVLFWHTSLTLWVFLSTALLLGAVTLLLVSAIIDRGQSAGEYRLGGGMLPVVVVLAAGIRLVLGLLQLVRGFEAPVSLELLFAHLVCVMLGLLALFLAVQKSGRMNGGASASFTGFVFVATGFLWAAEICGRIMFYEAFARFTI